jgi:hypothetical protein
MIVADLTAAGWVLVVRRLFGDLIEHLNEVHVDARVALDELLKLLQHGDKLFRVLIDMLDGALQPLAVDVAVLRQPLPVTVS